MQLIPREHYRSKGLKNPILYIYIYIYIIDFNKKFQPQNMECYYELAMAGLDISTMDKSWPLSV